MQRAGGRGIVAITSGSAPVRSGKAHIERRGTATTSNRENFRFRAAVALANRHVVDRDRARSRRRVWVRRRIGALLPCDVAGDDRSVPSDVVVAVDSLLDVVVR